MGRWLWSLVTYLLGRHSDARLVAMHYPSHLRSILCVNLDLIAWEKLLIMPRVHEYLDKFYGWLKASRPMDAHDKFRCDQ